MASVRSRSRSRKAAPIPLPVLHVLGELGRDHGRGPVVGHVAARPPGVHGDLALEQRELPGRLRPHPAQDRLDAHPRGGVVVVVHAPGEGHDLAGEDPLDLDHPRRQLRDGLDRGRLVDRPLPHRQEGHQGPGGRCDDLDGLEDGDEGVLGPVPGRQRVLVGPEPEDPGPQGRGDHDEGPRGDRPGPGATGHGDDGSRRGPVQARLVPSIRPMVPPRPTTRPWISPAGPSASSTSLSQAPSTGRGTSSRDQVAPPSRVSTTVPPRSDGVAPVPDPGHREEVETVEGERTIGPGRPPVPGPQHDAVEAHGMQRRPGPRHPVDRDAVVHRRVVDRGGDLDPGLPAVSGAKDPAPLTHHQRRPVVARVNGEEVHGLGHLQVDGRGPGTPSRTVLGPENGPLGPHHPAPLGVEELDLEQVDRQTRVAGGPGGPAVVRPQERPSLAHREAPRPREVHPVQRPGRPARHPGPGPTPVLRPEDPPPVPDHHVGRGSRHGTGEQAPVRGGSPRPRGRRDQRGEEDGGRSHLENFT